MEYNQTEEYQAESRCQACGRSISSGQAAEVCDDCGAVFHAACRENGEECPLCRPVRVVPTVAVRPPEIRITTEEARSAMPRANVPLYRSALRAANDATTPSRRPARGIVVVACMSSCMALALIPGILLEQPVLLGAGFVFAFFGIILGVVGAMVNWSRKRLSPFSLISVLASCALVVSIVFADTTILDQFTPANISILNLDIAPPSDSQLAALVQPIADAMRANVVIVNETLFTSTYGAGVITRAAEGKVYILTNKHVLGRGALNVHFQNGMSANGQVVWLAPHEIDLAFIACEMDTAEAFTAVPVYRGAAAPGEVSFAIGNPLQLPWTYTTGVISSLRSQTMDGFVLELYQTQTAINIGNSGGGLYIGEGLLIGVNTWTQSKSVAEGISFSISTRSLLELLSGEEARTFIERIAGAEEMPMPVREIPERNRMTV